MGSGWKDVAVGLQDDRRTADPASLSEIAVVGFGGTPPDPTRPGFSGLVVSHLNEPALFDDRGRVSFGQASGGDVAGVGDWDGDGLGDVAFGAAGAGPSGRPNAGSVYVVLGRREAATIDVRTGAGVVRIDGPARASEIGSTLGAAGDVDGDGRPDLAIALPGERAVIVRGGVPAGTTIDLARPPAGSTIELRGLDGGAPPTRPGASGPRSEVASFAAAGDVDGDGRGELVVGVPAANPLGGRGKVLVVRGAAGGSVVDAADPRTLVARVVAPKGYPGFGGSVAAMPDTDGDGHPEWVIGAAVPDGVFGVGGELPSGAFVVFSRARGEVRPGRSSELFLGARPFESAAQLDLWRVPLTALAGPSPALPGAGECLSVAIAKRSRGQLRRAGVLRVLLRSDAGDGQAHRLRLRVEIYGRKTFLHGAQRVVTLRRAGRRRLTLPLPRGADEMLARRTTVTVAVTAEQRVGSGVRATSGAFSGDAITFPRR